MLKNNKLTEIVPWEHSPRDLLPGGSPEICNLTSFSLRKIKLTLVKGLTTNINHLGTWWAHTVLEFSILVYRTLELIFPFTGEGTEAQANEVADSVPSCQPVAGLIVE